jgi:uncharacterized protein (TIGR00251 family)
MTARAWIATTDGLVLSVRLTPKGGRDVIEGVARLADGRSVLNVRVRAPPRKGEANAALVALIASSLGVPRRDVSVVAGLNARLKRVKIAGSPALYAAALERICADEGHATARR